MSDHTHTDFLNNAIAAAASAIESYNRPQNIYRSQIFVTLMVNAWELLLKAKIIFDNSDDVESIYVSDGTTVKKNRNGAPLTLDILAAAGKTSLSANLRSNIESLVEIRDTVIHFISGQEMQYIVFSLATASVTNFRKVCVSWFNRDLAEYNFSVLPLSFDYDFLKLARIDVSTVPQDVAILINSVLEKAGLEDDSEYFFMCEIGATLVSIKKLTEDSDLIVGITNDSQQTDGTFIERQVNILDQYPYSYRKWQRF